MFRDFRISELRTLSNNVPDSFDSITYKLLISLKLGSYFFGHYPRPTIVGNDEDENFLKIQSPAFFDYFCFMTIEYCKLASMPSPDQLKKH